jgi:hypothetical protein
VGSGLRDRVAAGFIDEVFVEGARRVARGLTRSRPGPTNPGAWTAEDIDDLIHDVVVKVRPERIVLKANGASNDAEFREWLRTAVRSVLDSRAGRTPTGRVIRAMDDALREKPERFVLATTGHWALTDDDRPAGWGQGPGPLVMLAWTIPTKTVQISAGATKTPPMAYRRDIQAVAAAVLELAGPLSKVDLAEVLAERFNALFAARFDYLDLDTDRDTPPDPGTTQDAAGSTVDDDAARWMLGQLTADERRALAILAGPDGSIRTLGADLGCTKHKAELIRRRLAEKVRRLAELIHDDDHGATARLLEILGHNDDLRRSLDRDEPRDVA